MFGSKSIAKALCALLILTLPGAALARNCPPVEVRAISYNIRLDLASDGANAWPYRRDNLIGQVEIIRPDIIGMQEVLPKQRREIAAALPGYEFVGVARDDGKDAGEYSPLGIDKSEFQIVESGTFWLSPTPDRPSLGWDASYKRIATWARLRHRKSGTSVLALNTHWDHRGLVARRESGALISSWIARNRKPGDHLLLLGDFNAPLTEESMAALKSGGLVDSRSAASSATGGDVTFNGFQILPGDAARAVDHILVDPVWKVRRHATIAQHFDGRVASDHFPVVADLTAPAKRCGR